MSNQQKPKHVPDATGKTLDSDKYKEYESYRSDSGFISGEITDSGHIEEEEEESLRKSTPTDRTDDNHKESETDVHMLIDSGVCLSENFSKISISKGLNDLDTEKKAQTPVASKQAGPGEHPWETYYTQNEDEDTYLHLAIAGGFADVALALIRAAPHPRFLDTPNIDEQTPLHLAVETKQHNIVRWLIVAGAKPCPRDLHGDSPLHIAARSNDFLSVQAIADPVKQQERLDLSLSYQGHMYKTCDFDQWNYLGQTCVHVAALYGNVQVLRHLVWYGANVNAREGCSGYSALHLAVERQDESLLQFLLQCQGIEPEIETYGGKTVLEVNGGVSAEISNFLRSKGVPSPYPSDEEFEEDSDDEIMYENTRFSMSLVNASA